MKERLGHALITTTEQYLHTLPGAHDAALDALDVIRGKKGLATMPSAPSGPSKDEVLEMLTKIQEMYLVIDKG